MNIGRRSQEAERGGRGLSCVRERPRLAIGREPLTLPQPSHSQLRLQYGSDQSLGIYLRPDSSPTKGVPSCQWGLSRATNRSGSAGPCLRTLGLSSIYRKKTHSGDHSQNNDCDLYNGTTVVEVTTVRKIVTASIFL